MGTVGTDPLSAGFSCVPGIVADDEAISSSPPDLLSVGSGFAGIDAEDGSGGLEVESRVDFPVDNVEPAFNNQHTWPSIDPGSENSNRRRELESVL